MKNATLTNTALIGALVGLAGIEHGVGEILQGSIKPAGWMIQSWPGAKFMEIVNGEPALTVVPNLLVTGVLAILFSVIFISWATLFRQRRNTGLVLMLVCVPMLLFGAGFAPPILGLIIGAAAAGAQARTRANAPETGRGGSLGNRLRILLGRAWPWSLGACLAAWLAMMPGTMLLNTFWGVYSTGLVVALILAMFGLLFLTILAGYARDSTKRVTG